MTISDSANQKYHTPAELGDLFTRTIRVDAHCHTLASDGPAVRALGWIGCPESYSPPERVYEQAIGRGMDLVAITDHDTIAGAMSLVERGFDRVIVGEEVTVVFPEDGCKLHVLVWGLTPELHEEIETLGLRRDVYAFAGWLRERNLAHSFAHPLYVQHSALSRWHLDRCALLFKGWEILNGAHSGTHRRGLEAYLSALTPGRIHRLTQEHGLTIHWPRIWEKGRTGGSDDHALLNVGRTWTEVDLPRDVEAGPREFLREVMGGRSRVGGTAGHSALLAHQLVRVGAEFAARRIVPRLRPIARKRAGVLLRMSGVDVPSPSKTSLLFDAIRQKVSWRRGRPRFSGVFEALGPAISTGLATHPGIRDAMGDRDPVRGSAMASHDEMASFIDGVVSSVQEALATGVMHGIKDRRGREIVNGIASALLVELARVPYVFSMFHQNKERPFVDRIEHESVRPGSGESAVERPTRVVLFTDTLGDVNGVSRFIRNAADQAAATGRDLTVLTSTRFELPRQKNIVNFVPIFATAMPKYENLEIVVPPLARMLRWLDQNQPDVVHISTPGPVGCVGYVAAKMLKVPVVGVYHTDFPAYIEHLFEDEALTWLCSKFMKGFYAPFRSIFTRSRDYVEALANLGIRREVVLPLMPGIRVEEFHPRFKDRDSLGDPQTLRALFVGRVSIEKNMPLLSKVWREADRRLKAKGIRAELVIVGDGPYRTTMEEELRGTRTRFLGFKHGEELSKVYASCDLFAFTSLTDTLGQVVMESQASGMGVLVSDQGGPKEVVEDGVTGHVLPGDNAGAWVDRLVELFSDRERLARMGEAAHESMQKYSMRRSFEHFWEVHVAVHHEALARHGITRETLGTHGVRSGSSNRGVAKQETGRAAPNGMADRESMGWNDADDVGLGQDVLPTG